LQVVVVRVFLLLTVAEVVVVCVAQLALLAVAEH
jgi:hypothetical protein